MTNSRRGCAPMSPRLFRVAPLRARQRMIRSGFGGADGRRRRRRRAESDGSPRDAEGRARAVSGVQGHERRRSEERRVGKECRSRWSAYHEKKKKRTNKGWPGYSIAETKERWRQSR